MPHITGEFRVKLTPQAPADGEEPSLGRLLIDKQFHGELEAISRGQMLAVRTVVEDSAGYVALERVNGTLQGQRGSFVLQHNGISNHGRQSLTITVVPDSGTDDLTGLTGKMGIRIEGGKHFYDFDYTLP